MAESNSNDVSSGSSEESIEDEPWLSYKLRSEWKDVEPIELDEGPFPVVAIAYSDRFREVFSYFRAITKSNEVSERAFKLTTDALDLNPANYTVWQYRRILLKGLNKNLEHELVFVRRVIEDHPKNYQVWHHRRVLVEWLDNPSHEMRLTEIILSQDAKNYHAWQHRQWVLDTFKLFEQEMEFVERLLEEDVRNNSAWNQRYFIVKKTTGFTEEVINRELKFTVGTIKKVSANESAWNYLRGILSHHSTGLNGHPIVEELCQFLESHNSRVPFYLALLVDKMEEEMKKNATSSKELLPKADQLLQSLANDLDPIRREYWLFLSRYMNSEFAV